MPSGVRAMVMIQVTESSGLLAAFSRRDLVEALADEGVVMELAQMQIEELVAEGKEAVLMSASPTMLEGDPGFMMDYSIVAKRLGMEMTLYLRKYQIYTQGYMFHVQFGFGNESELQQHEMLMFSMMNSVVFPGKW